MKTYHPVKFHDKHGKPIYTTIEKDNNKTMIVLRGVTFIGDESGCEFKPEENTNKELLKQFMIIEGYLTGYSMHWLESLKRQIWGSKEQKYIKLNELLDEIDANISEEDQQDKLMPFLSLNDFELETLTTWHYIKDSEAGYVLKYLGYERLKKYLPSLLEFLQDMNWPAAHYVYDIIVKAESSVIPAIKEAFITNDGTWQYWIINVVLRRWNVEIIELLKPDLVNLINKADFEGASIEALSILQDNRMLSNSEIKNYFDFLNDKYKDDEYWIKELHDSIKLI